ncbi:MAG TPA: GDP-mannose 4,6-dehydratase, partial [Ignavibacteriaceae bacterium]|nr:GDP-mannose 4,6-dehydratase [Ignavibacteriaceae bacterium]
KGKIVLQNKNILVTGGAGFLGSHLVHQLLERGNKVTILDDFTHGKELHLKGIFNNPNLKVIKGSITNSHDVEKAFENCQVVFHLAVLDLRQSIKEPEKVNDVVVNGTLNCLKAARDKKVELFVNCSSSEVFGTAQYVPMDEKHPLNPETPYAAAKVAQDVYTFSFGRTYGLPWVTVRPFNMYGPNSHWQGYRGELIPKMIVRAMNKQPLVIFGEGDQTRDFIYVEDAAKGIIDVARNKKCLNNHFNISTKKETSIKKIAETICKEFSLDPNVYIQKQAPRPGDVMRLFGDNSKFQQLTGYVPQTSIEEGIHKTIAWFKSLPYTPDELLNQEVLRSWE